MQLPELFGKRVLEGVADHFQLLFYELCFFNVLFQLQQKSCDFGIGGRKRKGLSVLHHRFLQVR